MNSGLPCSLFSDKPWENPTQLAAVVWYCLLLELCCTIWPDPRQFGFRKRVTSSASRKSPGQLATTLPHTNPLRLRHSQSTGSCQKMVQLPHLPKGYPITCSTHDSANYRRLEHLERLEEATNSSSSSSTSSPAPNPWFLLPKMTHEAGNHGNCRVEPIFGIHRYTPKNVQYCTLYHIWWPKKSVSAFLEASLPPNTPWDQAQDWKSSSDCARGKVRNLCKKQGIPCWVRIEKKHVRRWRKQWKIWVCQATIPCWCFTWKQTACDPSEAWRCGWYYNTSVSLVSAMVGTYNGIESMYIMYICIYIYMYNYIHK